MNNNEKYVEQICSRCNDVLNEVANISIGVAYDKCKGKNCPDCGKVRKLGVIKMSLFRKGAMDNCPKCGKRVSAEFDGICKKCFWEREGEKGCVCIDTLWKGGKYWCPLCESIHILDFKCGKCIDKINARLVAGELPWGEVKTHIPITSRLISPWKVIIPSVAGGFLLGVIIMFIWGKVIRNKSKNKTK